MGAGGLTSGDQAGLEDLASHWDEEYQGFTVTDGVFQASPIREPGRVITAASTLELAEKIRADFSTYKVNLAAIRGERMST